MRNSLQRRPLSCAHSFAVGTTVVVAPHDLRGIVVDLVLDENSDEICYAVVAFDTGSGGPVVYQPIRWNLLRRVGAEFVVNAAPEAIETGLPAALAAMPLSYGGNARSQQTLIPTPQSMRVH